MNNATSIVDLHGLSLPKDMHVQEEYGKNEDIVAIVTIFFIVSFAQYNCMSLIDFREQILKLKDFNEAFESYSTIMSVGAYEYDVKPDWVSCFI